jgi:hypothetical protein
MRLIQDDPEFDVLHDYHLEFTLGIKRKVEPHDYVLEIDSDLVYVDDRDESTTIGTLEAKLVHVKRALDAGERLVDIFEHTYELCDIYSALFDSGTQTLREAIDRFFNGVTLTNLLILSRMQIEPEHRGRMLGLVAVCRMLDVLGSGSGLAVCQPYPLQFSTCSKNDAAWRDYLAVDEFVRDLDVATAKLRKYWERLGFRRIPTTPFFALSFEQMRPTLNELLGD